MGSAGAPEGAAVSDPVFVENAGTADFPATGSAEITETAGVTHCPIRPVQFRASCNVAAANNLFIRRGEAPA